jgi:acyl-CoA synthetase (AMP-forming)/AMP-acid ligase II
MTVPSPRLQGTTGRIAVDMTASALAYFTGYHGDTDTTGRFTPDGRWWLTGDAGYIDADGYYFFSPRDDVIIIAGYRIGPFDVESVLVTHHQVIEAAAIGVPDELRGQAIEAFAVLRDPGQGNEGFAAELRQLVKDKSAAHATRAASIPGRPSQDPQRQDPAVPSPPAPGRIRHAVNTAAPRGRARPSRHQRTKARPTPMTGRPRPRLRRLVGTPD